MVTSQISTAAVQLVLWAATQTNNATPMQIAYQKYAQMKAYAKQPVVKTGCGTGKNQIQIVEKVATTYVKMIATAIPIMTAHLECALILLQSACRSVVVTV
jgi:hypothetical protein